MQCQECGFEQSDTHRFCGRCGAMLAGAGERNDQVTSPFAISEEEIEAAVWQGEHAVDGPSLAVRSGGPTGTIFALSGESVTIGRSPASDIFLDDVTVSRDHALIEQSTDGAVVLKDMGSLNGTYVNRHRIERAERLENGDELQIGKFRLTYLAG
jgi:hypothetical protein